MIKKIPTPIAIGIILILAVAVGAGVWWYGEENQTKIIEQPARQCDYNNPDKIYISKNIKQCPVIKYTCESYPNTKSFSDNCGCGCEIIDVLNTSDWQTYRNEKYGFEVKYPEDWFYEKESDFTGEKNAVNFYPKGKKKTLEYNGDIVIFYYRNPNKLSIDEFFNGSQGSGNYFNNQEGEQDLMIDNVKAKIFKKIKGGFESMPTNITIPLNDKFIIISDVYSKYKDNIFRQILSTFRFIK